MTTVVYHSKHRIMASDSRSSDEHDAHFSQCQKVWRLSNGVLYGAAGDSDDRDLRSMLSKSSPRKLPTRKHLLELRQEISAIVVFPTTGQFYTVEVTYDKDNTDNHFNASVDLIREDFVAIGSGYQFALGAMEAGIGPLDAVRAACRRDLASALPIQWEGLIVKGNTPDDEAAEAGRNRAVRSGERVRSVRSRKG